MERGDHLVSARIGYQHHGLYLGNGRVIHYSGFSEAFDKGTIEETSLAFFEQGNPARVETHLLPLYGVEERVERAYSRIGEDEYNLYSNNCEHFVNWCFGIKESQQVDNVQASLLGSPSSVFIAPQNLMLSKFDDAIIKSVVEDPTAQKIVKVAATATGVSPTAAAITGATVATTTVTTGVLMVAAANPLSAIAVVGYSAYKLYNWFKD